MGEAERREVTILVRKVGEAVDDNSKLLEEERECLPDEDQVRVAAVARLATWDKTKA